ncbi:hypothetical protein D515_01987 [Grimontia indica]|uniref:Uncharacterized protein n=1 Tax=Grimontia indica TaxID=1056512 RepID=R1GSZ8_9GAMM|nr:hypothetical protein D515_01987 [Grimontia indica]
MWGIFAALSASHVGELHIEASALHKTPHKLLQKSSPKVNSP